MTFTCNATTWISSRNPDEPSESLRFNQATKRTAGGVAYGYDPVLAWEIIPFTWSYLPDADVLGLITFVESVINWLNPFTVVDPSGETYTAELDTPNLEIDDLLSGGKRVSLTLRRTL